MKDIKKEIERYSRNNYTRKETIERLTMEGFDISEINKEMEKQMDAADDRIVLNMIYFFPSFVYLFILVVLAILGINVLSTLALKSISFLALIGIVLTAIFYYKENKKAVLIVAVLLASGFLFSIYALFARLVLHFEIPFFTYWLIVPTALFTSLFAKLNYEFYKE